MGPRDAAHKKKGGGGVEPTKLSGILNLTWKGLKKTFTKIEVYVGMVEQLLRYLAIEEDLQDGIK